MRPLPIRNKRRGSQEYESYMDIDGEEVDVAVVYAVQPPEPDVGVDGGIEIEGVYRGSEDVTGLCDKYQLECWANEINEYLVSSWEAAVEDYGRDY